MDHPLLFFCLQIATVHECVNKLNCTYRIYCSEVLYSCLFKILHGMHFQVYVDPPGFSCPGVPIVPMVSVFFNMLLFAQVCMTQLLGYICIFFL